MPNYVDLDFADGEYRFALPLAQIDELQQKCGAGIGQIFARTLKGARRNGDEIILSPGQAEFYAADIIETITQGLIGGKGGTVNERPVMVDPSLARRLVKNYVLEQPLSRAWEIAVAVLGAVIVGYDPPKKDGAAAQKAQDQTEENSTTASP